MAKPPPVEQPTESAEMGYVLRIARGPAAGRVWRLSERPLVIGRGVGCHIQIEDPHVSRCHCQVALVGGQPQLQDLGSRNPTLVNGEHHPTALLKLGDELGLGATTLCVERPNADGDAPVREVPPTVTLPLEDVVHLHEVPGTMEGLQTAHALEEMHALFALSRKLAAATSLEGLTLLLHQSVGAALAPDVQWLALKVDDDGKFILMPPDPPHAARAPLDLFQQCCGASAGMLVPAKAQGSSSNTLVAPLRHANHTFGVLAIRRDALRGAYDAQHLSYLVAVAETAAPLIRAVERLEQILRDKDRGEEVRGKRNALLGASACVERVRALARTAASSRLPVLLQGETGTGKELLARMLHDLGPRRTLPYVVVNCAAVPRELFESEMFGHERGAFTGASSRHLGRFEVAHGGTLFLDEIADLAPDSQARLLRVLESGEFQRVGGTRPIRTDTRVVVATNRNLPAEVAAGRFREDLYYRLNGFVITLPPLREMREDIPLLAANFAGPRHVLAPDALHWLCEQPWHGNIRELRVTIERACCLAQSTEISLDDVAPQQAPPPASASAVLSLAEMERRHILSVLAQCNDNVRAAAKALGISHVTLYAKLRQFEVQA